LTVATGRASWHRSAEYRRRSTTHGRSSDMSHKRRRPPQSRSQRQGTRPASRPWWHSTIARIGGVVAVLIAAAAAAYGSGLGQELFKDTIARSSPSGPPNQSAQLPVADASNPVTIQSIAFEPANGGDTFVFPQKLQLSTRDIASLGNTLDTYQAYASWATRKSGAFANQVNIQLTLRGNVAETVEIVGIQVVRHCQPPLTGTLLYNPSAGANQNVQMGIDLDNQFPFPQDYTSDGILTGNYFAEHNISLRPGESIVLLVGAQTATPFL
jgi:hypothetical protein